MSRNRPELAVSSTAQVPLGLGHIEDPLTRNVATKLAADELTFCRSSTERSCSLNRWENVSLGEYLVLL